ncbi:50S ribosomal protein L25 [candidate division KSB1 bacterium]|nr:50S ribosomal protein L25 [candidate division KSB1 bacterium]
MQKNILTAEIRTKIGKSETQKIRRAGKVLANYYFHGEKNKHLVLNKTEIQKIIGSRHGILDLQVGETTATKKCVIREIQYHPITGDILHVDFMGVKLTEKISVSVPVHLTGSAPGVREGGGTLQVGVRELRIECLTKDLPEIVNVDISNLQVDQSILVKDLQIPHVTIMTDPEQAVVSIKIKRVAEEKPAEAVGAEAEAAAKSEAE